jgi:Fic-DOC domain mobile mystery protein B
MSEPFDQDGEPDGATPLTEDEAKGLRPSWVATRSDLNLAERENILKARQSFRRRPRTELVLDEQFVRRLHGLMFGDVWDWAGRYRDTERNIGIDPWQIRTAVADLVADVAAWLTSQVDPMDPTEAAVRVHHRMVAIHPFPNGNGRHAREFADLLLRSTGLAPFTWGARSLVGDHDVRTAYIHALRLADKDDYTALRDFVRS